MTPKAPPASGRTGAGNGGPNAASVPAAANAGQGETIEQCILRNLHQYFDHLGGAKPHALHEMVMQAAERPLLKFAMQRAGGNQSAAAALLGINRNTLRKKLLEYRLDKE